MLDVVELGVAAAQQKMARGECSARELAQAYLDRIAAIDRAEPTLASIIELNPAALDDATALDDERAAGRVRGALHGIPVLLKDNIDAVGTVNSAGSLALAGNRPGRDAFLVARLRAAGAVILGKTNLSEWANFRSPRSTSGWSSRGGQTRNPYALDRNPGGSSAGTGAAIAASLACVGVGTETDGSIINPAALNGLVGLKPTVGLVSRGGIIPISISQDTAGPMGRTVADVAALLNALAGIDDADPARPPAAYRPPDYTAALDARALAGARLGRVLDQPLPPIVDSAMQRAVGALREAGATVVDVTVDGYRQRRWGAPEIELMLYEFKDGLNAYLKSAVAAARSLEALIGWNKDHRATVMPWFGQELFLRAQAKGPLTDSAYIEARDLARRLARDDGLLAALSAHRLDALIVASAPPAWLTDPLLGDHHIHVGGGAGMAAVAGTPCITVPMGDSHGLPLGVCFMGPAYAEAQLIGFAHAFEQATRARTAPRFLASITTGPELADAHR